MSPRTLEFNANSPFRQLVGVGGIGTGLFFELEGNHTLGRNESRPARFLSIRDYCKLHIISHYVAVLLGANPNGSSSGSLIDPDPTQDLPPADETGSSAAARKRGRAH